MVQVLQGTIFFQFICDTIFISTSFFQLEMVKKPNRTLFFKIICFKLKFQITVFSQTFVTFDIKMMMTIFASLLAIFSILSFFYYASRITSKIEQMSNNTFESRWYKLPIELQKRMKFMIAFAQIRFSVNGYGFFSKILNRFHESEKMSI